MPPSNRSKKRRGRPTPRRRWGRVRQLPSGQWQARAPDPTRPGLLVPAPQTFTTEVDADRWLAAQETDQARGIWIDPSAGQVTLSEYTETWLAHKPNLRPRTVELYRWLLKHHVLPALGQVQLSRLTPTKVRSWHSDLLGDETGASTVAKAYRLLSAILNTAVADELILKNPCRVQGAGAENAPERPVATVAEVEALTDAMPPRLRLLVLLAAWCCIRRGELLGLQRQDFDLLHGKVRVERVVNQLQDGTLLVGPPKTAAGVGTVTIPPHLLPEAVAHLDAWVETAPDALVFTGKKGGPLRPGVLQGAWNRARLAVGRPDLHLHDLRHTGNTLTAITGASTKEQMARMRQASPRAALIYQHATEDRDAAIAAALSELAKPAEVIGIASSQTAVSTRDGAREGHDTST